MAPQEHPAGRDLGTERARIGFESKTVIFLYVTSDELGAQGCRE